MVGVDESLEDQVDILLWETKRSVPACYHIVITWTVNIRSNGQEFKKYIEELSEKPNVICLVICYQGNVAAPGVTLTLSPSISHCHAHARNVTPK